MRIGVVCDVACPWCAIGLNALEHALERLRTEPAGFGVETHFPPFELYPTLGPEGEDATAYLKAKSGLSDARLAASRAMLRERGAAVGFAFGERLRVWHTFDAHRLLHHAALPGGDAQRRLEHALPGAYHRDRRNPGAAKVLLGLARDAGLAEDGARIVIGSGGYADDVRAAERAWQQAGVRAVPSVVIDGRHHLQGAQPRDAYVQALPELAQ